MRFTNSTIKKLAGEYHGYIAKKEGLQADLGRIRAQIADLEEAGLTDGGDPAALAAAKGKRETLKEQIAAADRLLDKTKGEVAAAMSAEIEAESRNLGRLREQVAELRQAAAQQLGHALAILRFLQSPQGVFGPHEILEVKVGPLSGRKSEPAYYAEILIGMEAGASEVQTCLPEKFPEFAEFRGLTKKVRFLESWVGPAPTTAKTPADFAAAKVISGLVNKHQHLQVLVAQALALRLS